MLYDISYMRNLKQSNSEAESEMAFAGGGCGKGGNREVLVKRSKFMQDKYLCFTADKNLQYSIMTEVNNTVLYT